MTISASTDMLKVRNVVALSATATLSNGSTAAVTNWSSDASGVATVNQSGTVTGVAAGRVTITAESQGKTATRPRRVVPDYQGGWSGTYRVSSCTDSGNWTTNGWCNRLRGQTGPVGLTLTQSRDTVTGTVTFGGFIGSTSGPISDTGALTLTGTASDGAGTSVTITNWNTNSASFGSMTGSFSRRYTAIWASGRAVDTCDLVSGSKSATAESVEAGVTGRPGAPSWSALLFKLGLGI